MQYSLEVSAADKQRSSDEWLRLNEPINPGSNPGHDLSNYLDDQKKSIYLLCKGTYFKAAEGQVGPRNIIVEYTVKITKLKDEEDTEKSNYPIEIDTDYSRFFSSDCKATNDEYYCDKKRHSYESFLQKADGGALIVDWKHFELHRYTGKFAFRDFYYFDEKNRKILWGHESLDEITEATLIDKQGQGQCEEIPNKKF